MISPKVSGIGGVAQHVSKLIKKLESSGFEVDTISIENTLHIPMKGLYNPSFAFYSALKAMFNRFKGIKYDIAHGHNLPTWFSVKASKARAKILTLHGVYSKQITVLHGKFLGFLSKRFEVYATRRVNKLTCISKDTYNYYKKLGVNVEFIPNAIDLNDMPSNGLKLYDKQVVFVGRLSKEKGIDVLLDALKYVDQDIHLLVLGSGPLKDTVIRACKLYPNLHYLGYKPRYECLKYIAGSNLLVLPSRIEGMPTVLLEAMALKVPVIASRVPGVVDIVDDKTAVLVDVEQPLILARAINEFILNYPKSFVKRAYDRVVSEFNWDSIGNKYIKLYVSLLS